ncbi:hypothetical protein GCM10028797_31020 [Dyella agri]
MVVVVMVRVVVDAVAGMGVVCAKTAPLIDSPTNRGSRRLLIVHSYVVETNRAGKHVHGPDDDAPARAVPMGPSRLEAQREKKPDAG